MISSILKEPVKIHCLYASRHFSPPTDARGQLNQPAQLTRYTGELINTAFSNILVLRAGSCVIIISAWSFVNFSVFLIAFLIDCSSEIHAAFLAIVRSQHVVFAAITGLSCELV